MKVGMYMKVLLFTHSQDIDGAGCAVLATEAFSDVKIIPTKTFDITSNVEKFMNSGEIYSFDQIFVTDLCIKEPVLSRIDCDKSLKNKLMVLDHHKTEIEEGNDKYDFVNITVERNGRKESGTSLFYQYLLENKFLTRSHILDVLVEWTRQYDVWDWKKQENYNAKKLHILFETLGYNQYLELILNKIHRYSSQSIEFNDFENKVVAHYEEMFRNDILGFLSKMKVVEIEIQNIFYKVGYIRCPYKYRNDINEFIIHEGNTFEIDMVGMIMMDIDTVSYRQIKDIDVSIIAKHFGGKGHRAASSNSQSNSLFQELLKKYSI